MKCNYINLCGDKVSHLGIGTSNFVEYDQLQKTINAASFDGINYIDTAYSYLNGNCESYIGEWLKYNNRTSVYIATKRLFNDDIWKSESIAIAGIEAQAETLNAKYIDFFMLHGLDGIDVIDKWNSFDHDKVLSYLETMKSRGVIRHIGFSYYGKAKDLEFLLEQYDWDFVQLRYNVIEEEFAKSFYGETTSAYNVANSHKLKNPNFGVIVMEPFSKGLLFNIPYTKNIHYPLSQSLVLERLLRDNNLIISGYTKLSQYLDISTTYKTILYNEADESEWDHYRSMLVDYIKQNSIGPCINCYKCLDVCPNHYHLYYIARLVDECHMGKNPTKLKMFKRDNESINCGDCTACYDICPQIDIEKLIEDFNTL